jgi:hypothetical protein
LRQPLYRSILNMKGPKQRVHLTYKRCQP